MLPTSGPKREVEGRVKQQPFYSSPIVTHLLSRLIKSGQQPSLQLLHLPLILQLLGQTCHYQVAPPQRALTASVKYPALKVRDSESWHSFNSFQLLPACACGLQPVRAGFPFHIHFPPVCGPQAPASNFIHVKTNTYIISYSAPMIAKLKSLQQIYQLWEWTYRLTWGACDQIYFFSSFKSDLLFFLLWSSET